MRRLRAGRFQGRRLGGERGRALRADQGARRHLHAGRAPPTPGATTTSLFGPFIGIPVDHTYNDVLPSANLKFDLTTDLVARFAASRTMRAPDYSALGGFRTSRRRPRSAALHGQRRQPGPEADPLDQPRRALEWYFAPRSLLSVRPLLHGPEELCGLRPGDQTYLTFSSQRPTARRFRTCSPRRSTPRAR